MSGSRYSGGVEGFEWRWMHQCTIDECIDDPALLGAAVSALVPVIGLSGPHRWSRYTAAGGPSRNERRQRAKEREKKGKTEKRKIETPPKAKELVTPRPQFHTRLALQLFSLAFFLRYSPYPLASLHCLSYEAATVVACCRSVVLWSSQRTTLIQVIIRIGCTPTA